jgi:hypothetical protein
VTQAKEMLFQEEEERKADVARTTAGLRRAELDVQVCADFSVFL